MPMPYGVQLTGFTFLLLLYLGSQKMGAFGGLVHLLHKTFLLHKTQGKNCGYERCMINPRVNRGAVGQY